MKMIDTGLNRKVDHLGRFSMPMELRNSYKWPSKGTHLLVSVTDDHFIRIERDPVQGRAASACTGNSRPMDPMGRISLPSEIRDTYLLETGAMLHLWVNPGKPIVYIKKTGCLLCGSGEDLFTFKNLLFCHQCLQKLGREAKRL